MKKWNDLDLGWRASFDSAWEAFKLNTSPIGCVIQKELEYIQICFLSYSELENRPDNCERLLVEWEKDCKEGVLLARELYNNKTLRTYGNENENMEFVYNKILEKI